MCYCDPSNPLPFCGAVECIDPKDPFGLDAMSEAPPCEHSEITVQKRVHHFEETGWRVFEVRLSCAACKAPFLFHNLPKSAGQEIDLAQPASTDLTGRVARLVIKPEGGIG